MSDVILHHYDASPFAEKIRSILAYKRIPWRSVVIPIVMPKPDLVALTGGYRKTPVLQIGSDVYCDTVRIARLLDEISPERPVFRAEHVAVELPAGRWLDHNLFMAVVALAFSDPALAAATAQSLGGPEALAAFAKDRAGMLGAARVRPPHLSDARVILTDTLKRLEAQLKAAGPFLFGKDPGWLDFCAYHPLFMLRANAASVLEPYPEVRAWTDRIAAFGPREGKPLDALEAIEIACTAEPRALPAGEGPPLDGIEMGDPIEVAADDYGTEPTAGRLVHLGTDALALRRADERAGEVTVHFPRIGFRVRSGA